MLCDTVQVPWPRDEGGDERDSGPPCLTCSAHGWCTEIRSAAGMRRASILPITMSDLEQAALRKVAQMMVDTTGAGVTYSRIKAKLLAEFGEDLVERIKPQVCKIAC